MTSPTNADTPGSGREITGASLVAAERARQIHAEGWSVEHDREHGPLRLLAAANCYRHAHPGARVPGMWPWAASWWKPKGALRNLVRAGALAQAAFDVDPTGSTALSAAATRDSIHDEIDTLLDEVQHARTR